MQGSWRFSSQNENGCLGKAGSRPSPRSASSGWLSRTGHQKPWQADSFSFGLVLSFIGDMALVREDGFLVGLIAFALAHVAYTAAFVATGFNPWFAVPAAVATVFLFRVIRRWLNWKVPRWMERPVLSYMVLISIMMVAASGTTNGRIFVGAGLFYLSDLAVARNRFIDDTFGNKLFGLPLYYAGQLILATVVA